MKTDETTLLDQLKSLAKIDNPEVVQDVLEGVRAEDLSDAFPRLDFEDQLSILRQLDSETAANTLVELPTETARSLINELPDEAVAHYLDILPMDDAIELREELEPDRFEALLELIPPEDALEIRRLLAYPEDSVGRIMTERFFEVPPSLTMEEVFADIRRAPNEKYETVNDIYVLDEGRHLLGVFSLRKAIKSDPAAPAREVMRDDVVTATVTDPAEEAARNMARYGFYALPVLDSRGRMVGLFTGDDAQAILKEAESEDVLAFGGVSGDVEAYLSLSIWQIIWRRMPWLMILFVAETFTGAVLRHYMGRAEDAAQANQELVVLNKLALFIPLLIGAGGNAGSQVTTTITRALAIGEVRSSDAFHVWSRELFIAVIIGAALGLVGFIRGFFFWGSGFDLSLVVGLALPAIVVWAASVGSLLPLAAKRLRIDPAVMSAPFITTFVDATGLIIYFEIARRLLGLH